MGRLSGSPASRNVVPALARWVRFQRHAGSGRNLGRCQLELLSRQSSTCHSIGDAPRLCTSVRSSCSSIVHRLGTASGRRRFSYPRDSGCALRVAALPVPPPRPTPVRGLRLCSYPPGLPPTPPLLLALQLLPLHLPRLHPSFRRARRSRPLQPRRLCLSASSALPALPAPPPASFENVERPSRTAHLGDGEGNARPTPCAAPS